MTVPRFGENFNPDASNRMEFRRKTEDLPEYFKLSRELREYFKKSVEQQGWPEMPESGFNKVEDFFELSQARVKERFQNFTSDLLEKKLPEWLEQMPDDREHSLLRKYLGNSEEFKKNFKIGELADFELIRGKLPDEWRSLVLLSSELQLSAITLQRHWLRQMRDEDFKRLGFSQEEMEIFLDLAGLQGKYFDQGYVKQIELADAPGGTGESSLGQRVGADRLYDVYRSPDSDEVDLKTYGEVFPFEWEKIVDNFEMMSKKVAGLNKQGKLPKTYRQLPDFLHQVGQIHGSKETNLRKLNNQWQKLSQEAAELVREGCPVTLFVQSNPDVAGEANKIDVELRFGITTPELQRKNEQFAPFVEAAQGIINENSDKLKKVNQVPVITSNYQPFAFGPNLWGMTRAEYTNALIASHVNSDVEAAVQGDDCEYAYLKKVMPGSPVTAEQYKEGVVTVSMLHEIGHSIMTELDGKVVKRIGKGRSANILDELKAESMGMRLLYLAMEKTPGLKEKADQYFTNEFGTLLNYLSSDQESDTSGTDYFYLGSYMIQRLMDKGVLTENGGQYQITDAIAGIKALAGLGEEILSKFYTNDESTPQEVKKFHQELNLRSKDPRIQNILDIINGNK